MAQAGERITLQDRDGRHLLYSLCVLCLKLVGIFFVLLLPVNNF